MPKRYIVCTAAAMATTFMCCSSFFAVSDGELPPGRLGVEDAFSKFEWRFASSDAVVLFWALSYGDTPYSYNYGPTLFVDVRSLESESLGIIARQLRAASYLQGRNLFVRLWTGNDWLEMWINSTTIALSSLACSVRVDIDIAENDVDVAVNNNEVTFRTIDLETRVITHEFVLPVRSRPALDSSSQLDPQCARSGLRRPIPRGIERSSESVTAPVLSISRSGESIWLATEDCEAETSGEFIPEYGCTVHMLALDNRGLPAYEYWLPAPPWASTRNSDLTAVNYRWVVVPLSMAEHGDLLSPADIEWLDRFARSPLPLLVE